MNRTALNRQKIINDNLRKYFQVGEGINVNKIRLNTGSTLEHEMKKCEIAYNSLKEGFSFIMEGKLKNNKRPDIVILDINNPIAYEVMYSEEFTSIKKKYSNYLGIKVIPVQTHLFSPDNSSSSGKLSGVYPS